jgi:hypothetical protein
VKRNAFVILLLAFAASILAPPTATAFGQYGDFWYVSDGSAITIFLYDGPGGSEVIPSTIAELPVTTIANGTFHQCTTLTSVEIPASVTNVGSLAFSCCTSLTAINVDPGNTSYTSVAGVLIRYDTDTLVCCPAGRTGDYMLPFGITAIGDDAFFFCSTLTRVTITSFVTNIGQRAFGRCDNLARVNIPDSVTTIGDGAFASCTSLTSVTIPDSVTTIGADAYYGCSGLTNVIIGASVTAIGEYSFASCSNLSRIVIPDNITTIADYTFGHCTSLTNISIGSSVTNIGNYAFDSCSKLAGVTIPDSVTAIGGGAFFSCISLTSVYFRVAPPTAGSSVFTSAPATLYYLPAYASSWPATYADRPTKLWNPAFTGTAQAAGAISCTVTGSPPIPIALEATTNLATGLWVRLCTTNLANNSIILHDPDSSSHPARFYRIVGP